MNSKNKIIIIISLILYIIKHVNLKNSKIFNIPESQISITNELNFIEIKHEEKYHIFNSSYNNTLGRFIILYIIPEDKKEINHIYVNIPENKEIIPDYKNSNFKTINKNTQLVIELKKIKNYTTSAILIEQKENSNYIFYYQIVNEINLIDDYSLDIIINSNDIYNFKYIPSDFYNNKFLFMSNSLTDFNLKINYGENELEYINKFYNGYGFIANNETINEEKGIHLKFIVNINNSPSSLITITNQKIRNNTYINLNLGDYYTTILRYNENECFNLPLNIKNINLNFITYTKNIKVISENKTVEEKVIDFIYDENKVVNVNTTKFKNICISIINEEDDEIGTASFQVMYGDEFQTEFQDLQIPLLRGISSKFSLAKNQINYYKLNYYKDYSSMIISNIEIEEGNPLVYYGKCNNYPYCNFAKDNINKFEKQINSFSNVLIKKKIENFEIYNKHEFQAIIIYCPEIYEKCSFYITLYNNNDLIYLKENNYFINSINLWNFEKYHFYINDNYNDIYTSLKIEVKMISGDSDIFLYNDTNMQKENEITHAEFKSNSYIKYFILNKNDYNNLNGLYYIKIKAYSNAVYTIKYSLLKNNENIINNKLSNVNEMVIDNLLWEDYVDQYEKDYLFLFKQDESMNEKISLIFNKFSKNNLILNYKFGNEEKYETYYLYNENKKLVFSNTDFSDYCNNFIYSFCPLFINIKLLNSKNSKSYFDMIISSKNSFPTYLNKNQVFKNLIKSNIYQYYYFEILKNQESDITLYFLEGIGSGIAKIISEDEKDYNYDYNKKILLPRDGMENTIKYDKFYQKLKITKEMTNKCNFKCEIYIGIFQNDQKLPEKINEYVLYYRINEVNMTDITKIRFSSNIILYGSVKSIYDTHYYILPKYKNDLEYNIISQSDLVDIFIHDSKNKNLLYKLNKNNNITKLRNSNNYLISIKSYENIDGNFERYYKIKIIINYINHNKIEILYHNSDINEHKIVNSGDKFYYLVPIQQYNKYYKSNEYIYGGDDDEIQINNKTMYMEEFDKLTPQQKDDAFKIKNNVVKEIFNNERKKEEIYILYTISIIKNHIYYGLRAYDYNYTYSNYLNNINSNVYILNKENSYKIKILAKNYNNLFTISVDILNNNSFYEYLIDPLYKDEFLFDFSDSKDDNVFLRIYTESKANQGHFDYIYPPVGKINYKIYNYTKFKQILEIFPLSYYLDYKILKNNEQILFEFENNENIKNKDFITEGYLIDKEFYGIRKINKDAIIPEKLPKILGDYDKNSKIASITLSKDENNNYLYYYVIIKGKNEEKINIENFLVKIIFTNLKYINYNKYTEHLLSEEQNKFLLCSPSLKDQKMNIEIIIENNSENEYKITINNYINENSDYSKNISNIIEKNFYKNGKNIFYVNIKSDIKFIVVNIINNKNNQINNDYSLLKYRINNTIPENYFLENRNLNYIIKNYEIKLKFEGVRLKENKEYYSENFTVKYTLNIYDLRDFKNKEILPDNIIINKKPIDYMIKILEGKNTIGIKEIELPLNNNCLGIDILIYLEANASLYENEELFSYKTYKIKIDKKSEEKENENKQDYYDKLVIIIIIIFCVIIIITFIILFIYLYMSKDRYIDNINLNERDLGSIQRPSDRNTGYIRNSKN